MMDDDDLKDLLEIRNGLVVMSSLKVGEKYRKQHKEVLRAIKTLLANRGYSEEFRERNFALSTYVDQRGRRTLPMCWLTRDGYWMLSTTFTGVEPATFRDRALGRSGPFNAALRPTAR